MADCNNIDARIAELWDRGYSARQIVELLKVNPGIDVTPTRVMRRVVSMRKRGLVKREGNSQKILRRA